MPHYACWRGDERPGNTVSSSFVSVSLLSLPRTFKSPNVSLGLIMSQIGRWRMDVKRGTPAFLGSIPVSVKPSFPWACFGFSFALECLTLAVGRRSCCLYWSGLGLPGARAFPSVGPEPGEQGPLKCIIPPGPCDGSCRRASGLGACSEGFQSSAVLVKSLL